MRAHSRRAGPALRRLSEADPALGALALWCPHRDADGETAAWTDGRTVFYGPGFETLAPHEQAGLAAHQVLHIALRHAPRSLAMRGRFGDRFDEELFNIACDAILNQTLVLAGHALPRPVVLLADLLKAALPAETAVTGWDVEKLYIRLMADANQPGKGEGNGKTKGKGESQNGRPDAAEAARELARQKGFGQDLHAIPAPVEGEEDESPDPDAWRERLARAMEDGRSAGRGIGTLGTDALDLPQVHTPWERVLRRLVSKAVSHTPRPDWGRPARRWLAHDSAAREEGRFQPAFQPARCADRNRPRVAVAVDTSSSIDDARLGLFAAQVAGIGRRSGAEVHVLAFDTVVTGQSRMQGIAWESEIRRVDFARGGGTDFGPVIAAALALNPSVIVVLTDLDGPFGAAPKVPVIWAIPQEKAPAPPFGKVISLSR